MAGDARTRAAYRRLVADMREAFQRHDPVGLLALGAPEDEYDDAIHRAISLLQRVSGRDEVAGILNEAVGRGVEDVAESARESLATEIWAAWTRYRVSAG